MTITVTREESVYRPDGHSYFRDLLAKDTDKSAYDRLMRHAAEMRVELPKRATAADRLQQRLRDEGYGFERRVNPNRTDGQGGFFAPPLWLLDSFALYPRPERVIAALSRQYPLAAGVSSVNVPRLSAGTTTGPLPDLDADPDADITDVNTSSPVVTIAGQVDVSLQTLEQSPRDASFDELILQDVASSYDGQLEEMLTTGTGTGGTFTGVLNVSGVNNVTYTDASPSFAEMYPFVGQAFSAVSDGRKLRPEGFVMRGSRWSWIATSTDASGHLVMPPCDRFTPTPSPSAGATPVGTVMGLPTMTSESIPANLGTAANADAIIAMRFSDVLLFEGEATTMVDTEVLSGTLGARITMRRYAAAITGRFPSGIAVIGGTGMTNPASF